MIVNSEEVQNIEIIQDAFVAAYQGRFMFAVYGTYPAGVTEFPLCKVKRAVEKLTIFDFLDMATTIDFIGDAEELLAFAIQCEVYRLGEDWGDVQVIDVEINKN